MKQIFLYVALLLVIPASAQFSIVKDIAPGTSSSNPNRFTVYNGKLYFTAANYVEDSGSYELWQTNGTTSGTLKVYDLPIADGKGLAPTQLKVVNGMLLFDGKTNAAGKELWKTDGTTSGTMMVTDLNPGTPSGFMG